MSQSSVHCHAYSHPAIAIYLKESLHLPFIYIRKWRSHRFIVMHLIEWPCHPLIAMHGSQGITNHPGHSLPPLYLGKCPSHPFIAMYLEEYPIPSSSCIYRGMSQSPLHRHASVGECPSQPFIIMHL